MGFQEDQLVPGEVVVVKTREHALVLLRAILINVAALIVLSGVAYASGRPEFLIVQLLPAILLVWELVARQRKEFVVTSRRVVRQEGILSIQSFDAPLDKINNVFHTQTFLGRIFGFGDVGLETASEQGTTLFRFIPDPVGFKNAIVSEREAYSGRSGSAAARVSERESIPQLIEQLASLRDRKIISDQEFDEKKKKLLGSL
jgi:uncharacterized membrane protein YdbT with pleckstrin-like domain